MENFFCKAAKEGSQLIVTTEGVLEGYTVNDVIEGRRKPEELLGISEPIDGPYILRFQRLARTLKTSLAFGFAERVRKDVYNSALFIDGNGEIRGKHQKVQFAEGTDKSWSFNRPGQTLRAFDTHFGRVGFLICNDRWNPLLARTLVLDGAALILIPSYGEKRRFQNLAVLARARENGVPIVEANVGVNLLISKGETVAYEWGNDRITTATVEIPSPPSRARARKLERQYQQSQGPELALRYQETLKRLRGESNHVAKAAKGELLHRCK